MPNVTGAVHSKAKRCRNAVSPWLKDAGIAVTADQITFDDRIGDVVTVTDILHIGLNTDGLIFIGEPQQRVRNAPRLDPVIRRVEFSREIAALAAIIAAQCRAPSRRPEGHAIFSTCREFEFG